MQNAPGPPALAERSGAFSVSSPHPAWSLKVADRGIWLLTLDDPDRSANVFSAAVVRGFAAILTQVEQAAAIGAAQGLVIRSGKTGTFIVGADVEAIAAVSTEAEGLEAARVGQLLFGRLETLPIPTLVVLNGTCMGGGTELALACTHRVITDHPKARIALPEVQLGILPAWGGTTRLPRLIGLRRALPLLLTGRAVRGPEAVRMGLVDAIIPDASTRDDDALRTLACAQFAGAHFVRGQWKRRFKLHSLLRVTVRATGRATSRWLLGTPWVRGFMLRGARRAVFAQTGGQFPAPLRIIEVLEATRPADEGAGFALEAAALAELLLSHESKCLVTLFRSGERLRKSSGPGAVHSPPDTVGTAGRTLPLESVGPSRWIPVPPPPRGLPHIVEVMHGSARQEWIGAGRLPLVVKDLPGTLVPRVLGALWMGIGQALASGHTVADVRRATRAFGMVQDPLAGLTALNPEQVSEGFERLHRAFGERMRPPSVMASPAALRALRSSAQLTKQSRVSAESLHLRVILPWVLESIRAFDDGVVEDPRLLDAAVVFAVGFPPYLGGPLAWVDRQGSDAVLQLCADLAPRWGDLFSPPTALMVAPGAMRPRFYELGGSVASSYERKDWESDT